MKPCAKTALSLALAIVGGMAADPFIPLRVFASKPFASFALKSFFALNAFNAVFALKTTMEEAK